MLSSTNTNHSAPNSQNLYDPKMLDEFDYGSNWTEATSVIFPSVTVGVFYLFYTLASTCIYDANLKIFEPKRLRALKLCMYHDLVDVYKFCTQGAPGHITGLVLGLRHLYVGICWPIIRKFSG